MITVFVYGTLLEGLRFHHVLGESKFLGKKTGRGLQMYNLGPFPACVFTGNREHKVEGELYEVDEETLARLDRLESYPHMYNCVGLRWTDQFAWTYVMNREKAENCPLIESGDWREHCERQS